MMFWKTANTGVAVGEACAAGDVAKAQRILGLSKVGATKKSIEVDLTFRMQGLKAIETFAKTFPPGLESLVVSLKGCMLKLDGIKALAAALPPSLKEVRIDLSSNRILKEGVEIFMKALPKGLEVLTLGCHGMRLGFEGIKVIADNFPPDLKELYLDLFECRMGDVGAIYLCEKFPKSIEKLTLQLCGQNNLSRHGNYLFDKMIGDPERPIHLPNLKSGNFTCWSHIEVYETEVSLKEDHMVRILDPDYL